MPKRIQRKRTKGWRMPPNTVCVSRPSKWANPFRISKWTRYGYSVRRAKQIVKTHFESCLFYGAQPSDPEEAKAMERIRQDIDELRGKNVCCWCGLDEPCHGDPLLELANA